MDDIPACVSPVYMSEIKDIPVFQDLTLADPPIVGVQCNLCSQDGTVFFKDKACKTEKTVFLGGQLVDLHNFPALTPLLHLLV